MVKILITGLLLFVFMAGTAIFVSRHQPATTQTAGAWMSPSLDANRISILDASTPTVVPDGSGGIEDNPFVVIAGLVAIICFAFGFWKYHQIMEARRMDDEAASHANRTQNQFGNRPSHKDPPK